MQTDTASRCFRHFSSVFCFCYYSHFLWCILVLLPLSGLIYCWISVTAKKKQNPNPSFSCIFACFSLLHWVPSLPTHDRRHQKQKKTCLHVILLLFGCCKQKHAPLTVKTVTSSFWFWMCRLSEVCCWYKVPWGNCKFTKQIYGVFLPSLYTYSEDRQRMWGRGARRAQKIKIFH